MTAMKTIEIKVERTIPAPCAEVFDAWLDPKIPGTTWHAAEKFILDPKVDGLFFWHIAGNSHYGRFTKMERPGRIEHTWMSPSTAGLESTVIVTFTGDADDDCRVGRRVAAVAWVGWRGRCLWGPSQREGVPPAQRGIVRRWAGLLQWV